MDGRIEAFDLPRQLELGESSPHTPPCAAARRPTSTRQSELQPGSYGVTPGFAPLGAASIRLVRVTQNPITSAIECRTEEFPLKDPPPYTAISYACGPRVHNFGVHLNDVPYLIRKNLSRFLRQRVQMDPNSREWMWIDCLCID
jgi:hypothetical protein